MPNVLFYQGREQEAYDAFYKATWSNEQQEMSFYYLAAIDARAKKYERAYAHIEKALVKNAHNIKARGLKAYLLRKQGKTDKEETWIGQNLELDPFDFVSANEQIIISAEQEKTELKQALQIKMRDFQENYLMTARDYVEFGAYEEAMEMLSSCTRDYPMLFYYQAYYAHCLGQKDKKEDFLQKAEKANPDYCFPNKLEDIKVLQFAIENGCKAKACYYLGNLFYDKKQWEESISLWESSVEADDTFSIVWRNLALAYYNKAKDSDKAKTAMEKAYALDTSNMRIFLELDQLYKKLGWTFEARLANYEACGELIESRDDLYMEYITLVNLCGDHEKAYECIMGHHFHPWEGGEGKVTLLSAH